MSDDFKDDKQKEIEDFLNQFDKPDEVQDSFNKITDKFGKTYGGNENQTTPQKTVSSGKPPEQSPPISSRVERLHSQKHNKPQKNNTEGKFTDTLLLCWSSLCDFFNRLVTKLNFIEVVSDEEHDPTGENMTHSGKKKKYKINKKRLLSFFVSILLVICIAGGIFTVAIIFTTPKIDPDNIYAQLSENSVLYDDEGNAIENITSIKNEVRTNVAFNDIPEDLYNSFIAIEDKTFWDHHGFNFIRIAGAIVQSVTSGNGVSGTSTITQQLARNLYLNGDRTMARKVREAWYSVQLESKLTKEQIIEAYLNTINLGYGSYGVQAAAQAYFSKDISELNLAECAALATIPKSPSKYALLKGDSTENIDDPESLDIVKQTSDWTIWFNDTCLDRQHLVLKFLLEQGLITQEEHDEAKAYNLRDSMNPGISNATSENLSSYFADYTISQVKKDLMKEYKISEEKARDLLYTGGLRIYSTLDVDMQREAEKIFSGTKNFPGVTALNKDKAGNVRDRNNKIMLYKMSNFIDDNGNFTLFSDEFEKNKDGSLTLFKGKRLKFYKTSVQGTIDYSVEFSSLYTVENNIFYSIPGGVISIPAKYKSKDSDGNLVINAEFFQDKPDFFAEDGSSLILSSEHYSLKQKVMQPQSSMVIMDYKTGGIKTMIGGRSTTGRLLFNRSTAPQQPGSSFKPIGVYGPALQKTADGNANWTAASVIDDRPLSINGKVWPKNWYNGYRGLYTLRQSVENSVNVNAVKVFRDVGVDYSVEFAKKLGISSIVEKGDTNDLNAAALALGGMTKGASPLEMAAAYGAFANDGVYTEPICYTKVTNKNGDILLEKKAETHQAMDPEVASLMTDILRTTVSNGLAKAAGISSQPVAGKTGTTTDNFDAWFTGFTPYYSAAVWIGNDMNIELTQGSTAASRVWSSVMTQAHKGLERASFKIHKNLTTATIDTKSGKLASELSALDPRGSTVRTEYFVPGTEPIEVDDVHVRVEVCAQSGYLATPWCSSKVSKVAIKRPGGPVSSGVADAKYDAPIYYCNQHNTDTAKYPIAPNTQVNPNFVYIPPSSEEEGGSEGEGTTTPPEGGTTAPPEGGGTVPPTNPTPPNINPSTGLPEGL